MDNCLLSWKRRKNSQAEKIDNAAQPAGSPMIFYCKSCGWVADTKPEDYVFETRKYCSECEILVELQEIPATSSS